MFTLGFPFHPWKAAKAIADGPSILEYLHETAATYGIDKHIRFGRRVVRASWSSEEALWTVETTRRRTPARSSMSAAATTTTTPGYVVDFPGIKDFQGQVVHPQHWPEDLDYSGKRVVVIGSGATAVTLVPAMADRCPRDDAAALPQLRRFPTGQGRVLRPAAGDPAGEAGAPGDPREERRVQLSRVRRVPALACACGLAPQQHGGEAVARLDPRRPALHPAVQAVGPAALSGARRGPVRGAARRLGVGGTDEIETFTPTASGCAPGRNSKPTWS